jgi:hypothetical protein
MVSSYAILMIGGKQKPRGGVKTHKYWRTQNYRHRINENNSVNGAAIANGGEGREGGERRQFSPRNNNFSHEERNTTGVTDVKKIFILRFIQ